MIKPLLILTLATSLGVACSRASPPQSAAAGQDTPSASPAPASQPQAPESKPAAAPSKKPTPQSTPAATAPTIPAAAPSRDVPLASAPASAPPSNAAAPSQPEAAAPPAPKFREVTIPAGTSLSVTVLSTLASNTSKVEDPVKGSLAKPIVVSGTTVVPKGAQISGSVIDAKQSGRVKGKATIAFRFERLIAHGEPYRIQTARVTRAAAQDKAADVRKGGIGAGLGAIVGGVVGGGKGAAIGAVAGGTTGVMATKGKEVQVEPGTVVSVLLQEPVTVSVPIK